MLHFHHMNQDDKMSGLSTREMVGMKWARVKEEMRKCALLCSRCHGEVHAGIISKEDINKVYENEWSKILMPS